MPPSSSTILHLIKVVSKVTVGNGYANSHLFHCLSLSSFFQNTHFSSTCMHVLRTPAISKRRLISIAALRNDNKAFVDQFYASFFLVRISNPRGFSFGALLKMAYISYSPHQSLYFIFLLLHGLLSFFLLSTVNNTPTWHLRLGPSSSASVLNTVCFF